MWLICGLGNPGKKYQNTRHNIGFEIIESLIKKYNFKLYKKDKLKEIYKGKIDQEQCMICKSLVYMNQSGEAIGSVVKFYKIPNSKILIIHDDLDLAIGKVKIKTSGGNGGHNGLLSIDKAISNNYKRLRIGIGHPGSKKLVSSYVLKKFPKDDKKIINIIIDLIVNLFSLSFENESLLLTKVSLEVKKVS